MLDCPEIKWFLGSYFLYIWYKTDFFYNVVISDDASYDLLAAQRPFVVCLVVF